MTKHIAIAAVLVVSLLAAGASEVAGTSTKRPTLRLIDKSPVTFTGLSFRSRERVRVTVTSSEFRRARTVRATTRGTFVAEFEVTADRCMGLFARASGSNGSVAVYKLPQPLCPPRP